MPISNTREQPVATLSTFLQWLLSNQTLIALLQIVLASCFIGLCAQIKIPLYFTPVPLTIQTSSVMLVGAILGSRKGALAALCYLFQGCIGLPVWAGGAAGFVHFIGPTGGYLMAYVVQAYFIGCVLERSQSVSLTKIIGFLLLSICLQLGLGSLWLAQFVGIKNCLTLGFYPFIIGEVARALLVALYVKTRLKSQ